MELLASEHIPTSKMEDKEHNINRGIPPIILGQGYIHFCPHLLWGHAMIGCEYTYK